MLDRTIAKEGVLIFDGGRILIDGWETSGPCMCRELAVLACLFVANRLIQQAIDELREAGAGRMSIGPADRHRPASTPVDLRSADPAFEPWYRALQANDIEGYESALRYTEHLVATYELSRDSATEIEARMVMLACEVGGFFPRSGGRAP